MRWSALVGVIVGFAAAATVAHAGNASVAPQEAHEACYKVEADSMVNWSFEAAEGVDFNIHYHGPEGLVFIEKATGLRSGEGSFSFKADNKFCMMWRNWNPASVSLNWKYEPQPL